MKGVRFYAELPGSRASKAASKKHRAFTRAYLESCGAVGQFNNCIAVLVRNGTNGKGDYDAIGGVRDTSNAPVTSVPGDPSYLASRCVRVSEELARKLHPNLFRMLDHTPPTNA